MVEVNDKYNIIVEDKTFTSEHDKQIDRYKKILYEENRTNIIGVYFKIVEQCYPEKTDVNLTKRDLLTLFAQYIPKTNNNIFIDYYNQLVALDSEVERFKSEPIENWKKNNDHPYKGFFTHLINENVINLDRHYGWSYVANPSGGVRALGWYFLNDEDLNAVNLAEKFVNDIYLQIEDDIITVKMTGDTPYTKDVRWKLYNYIQQMVPEFKKKTFRPGKWMTIGYIPYNEKNYKEKIELMENVMQSIVKGSFKYLPQEIIQ